MFASWTKNLQGALEALVNTGRRAIAAHEQYDRAKKNNVEARHVSAVYDELTDDDEAYLTGAYRQAVAVARTRKSHVDALKEQSDDWFMSFTDEVSSLLAELPQDDPTYQDLYAAHRYIYSPDFEGPHSHWSLQRLLVRFVDFLAQLQNESYRVERAALFEVADTLEQTHLRRRGEKVFLRSRAYGRPNDELRRFLEQHQLFLGYAVGYDDVLEMQS